MSAATTAARGGMCSGADLIARLRPVRRSKPVGDRRAIRRIERAGHQARVEAKVG
jgi:hypothetical protein